MFAAKAGGSPELIAALRAGEPLDDERLESIRRFTEDRTAPDGLDAEEVLEVVAQIAYTTFANLAANVAETPIDDAFVALPPAAGAVTAGIRRRVGGVVNDTPA